MNRFSAHPLPPLLDGFAPLQPSALTQLIRDRVELAANWLLAVQRPNGSFAYSYDPLTDRYDSQDYNELRHAGTTYALFQAGAVLQNDNLLDSACRAADWIVDASMSVPSGGAAYLYNGACKLGGVALAIIALLEGRDCVHDARWDDAIAAFGTFLLALELPAEPGRYFQSFDAVTGDMLLTPKSNYYPGEALLALTRLHLAFPDGPWLAAAQRAAGYLIRVKDGDQIAANAVPRDDHWLTIALSELYRADPNPDYATIVRLQAERVMRNQIGSGDPEPWRIGAGRREVTPSFPSTATQAEALVAAWNLARSRDDAAMTERIAYAAMCAVQFLMRVQNTESTSAAFPLPARAVGGWSQDVDRPMIRIDFVQHGISALVGTARNLPPAGSDAAAEYASLEIVELRCFSRHNLWSPEQVLHLTVRGVDPPPSKATLRSAISRVEAELDRLPQGSIPPATREIRNLGELIAWAILRMQRSLGDELSATHVAPGARQGEVDIVVPYLYEAVATSAAQVAISLVRSSLDPSSASFDFLGAFNTSVAANHPMRACRPDVRSLLAAAGRRGVPIRRVDVERGLVELGTGVYGRRYWNLSTSQTSAHGVRFAKDKHWANRLLRDAGLPVPASHLVHNLDEAKHAAATIGYPIVLKPNLGSQGRDVFIDIRDDAELVDLYATALGDRTQGEWLLEQYVPGDEHRILVVGGEVVAVNHRMPPAVTGDGVSTVRTLVDRLNADPARSFQLGFALKPVVIGAQHLAMLRRQGLTLESVPASGQVVRLNAISNVSAGGSTRDVLDRLHPDNAHIARMAASVIGLDFAGIDLVAPRIDRSIWETGGAIIEINSHPGVLDHLEPGEGTPRDVGAAILEMLFLAGRPVRIPVIAVAASDDSAALCGDIANELSTAGRIVGCATHAGVFVDGTHYRGLDGSHLESVRAILGNPTVEVAIFEIDAERVHSYGLGFDQCDVVIIDTCAGRHTPGNEPVQTVLLQALAPDGTAFLNEADAATRALGKAVADEVRVHWYNTDETRALDPSRVAAALVFSAPSLAERFARPPR